jgi:hypothetical protein
MDEISREVCRFLLRIYNEGSRSNFRPPEGASATQSPLFAINIIQTDDLLQTSLLYLAKCFLMGLSFPLH